MQSSRAEEVVIAFPDLLVSREGHAAHSNLNGMCCQRQSMSTTISDVSQSDVHCCGLSAWDIPAVGELREPTCDLAVSQLAWKCLGMHRKINQGLSFLFTGVVAELRADSAFYQSGRSSFTIMQDERLLG